ncbi:MULTISPECIES: GntR family transcriptional regulator [Pseudocitrobacter]|nr:MULTISPECIES: GntR family transcriptional regulator [Pseudocitrobacter]KAA1050308.1 GntR family transcriptional regulator [Pseudocitrobacter sp. 73]
MFDFAKAQRLSLTQQVEQNLKNALIIGALKPGARLVTKDIAESQGISITPVREALLRLVSSGALYAAPAQAFLVPELNLQRYNEIQIIRKKLEGMAAAAASQKMTAERVSQLQQLVEAFHSIKSSGDIAKTLQANYQFRFCLYEFAEMPTLTALIEQLWVRVGPSFNYLYPHADEQFYQREFYRSLLLALAKGAQAESYEAMCEIIDESGVLLQQQYIN